MAEEDIFPVCAPQLAARLTRPEDLAVLPCLIDSAWADDWQDWAAVAMPGATFRPRGPVFSLYALAVEEAANGAGVLMAHGSLVAGHLARGQLVAPLPQRVRLPMALRLWSAQSLKPGHPAERVGRALLAP